MTVTFREFVRPLVWLDGRPLASTILPYQWRIFDGAFERRADDPLAFVHSLILHGAAKKNDKTRLQMLAELYALMGTSPGGNQVYHVANDEAQAADGLELAKKLVKANPLLTDWLTIKRNIIERRDGDGFLEILPAQDALGQHGKTFRMVGFDEIHGYRNWDLLESLAPDPTRRDAQWWITSYASIHHRPGAPLFDLLKIAKAGTDPGMLFSWYAADFTTDPDFADAAPESRANPSMASWGNPTYLEQQRLRLPAHKFRRLHLNLPGQPEGSAYTAEMIMDAVERGVSHRGPEPGITYRAFVDMSGGSSDDAVLGIGHTDAEGRYVVDRLIDQGCSPPFDPSRAILQRFIPALRDYRIRRVVGDAYAGQTFRRFFEGNSIAYVVSPDTKSAIFDALEPRINGRQVIWPDVPKLETQLLGLVWRGGRIDHPAGEHDDYANAAAGVVQVLATQQQRGARMFHSLTGKPIHPRMFDPRRRLLGVPDGDPALWQ